MVKLRSPQHLDDEGGYLGAARDEETEMVELALAIDEPAVSIVIPTYNHRGFVLDALDAVARQDAASFEIVIVDDGSVDDSFAALVERARSLGVAGRIVRLIQNRGRSIARNVGILHARATIIAFTDSDCVPTQGWVREGLRGFARREIGIVQGPTLPNPAQRQRFFNHFIQITRFDGTFSTCNVFYRRKTLLASGGFDPAIPYWQDVDLGWRVRRSGWEATFAPGALVHHQVVALTPAQWLRWPLHFADMPAKAAVYPECRRYLFFGVWTNAFHALFDLAVAGAALGAFVNRGFFALVVPYMVAFPVRHGLGGRWPMAKAALHLAWDALSFVVLVASSIRRRSLVL